MLQALLEKRRSLKAASAASKERKLPTASCPPAAAVSSTSAALAHLGPWLRTACKPVSATHAKVTLAQLYPVSDMSCAADLVDLLLVWQGEHECDGVPDVLVLPEGWLGEVLPEDRDAFAATLAPLAEVAKRHGVVVLAGTACEAVGSSQRYVTAPLLGADGTLCASYRKQRATIQGSHAEGKQCCVARVGLGGALVEVGLGILICFDVEHATLLTETLSLGARVVLNPTHIPATSTARSPTGVSDWRIQMEQMGRTFEADASLRGYALCRCDIPLHAASGTSQCISPYCTYLAPQREECILNTWLDQRLLTPPSTDSTADRTAALWSSLCCEAPRPRTDAKDNTGARYRVWRLHGHEGATTEAHVVDRMAAVSTSLDGTVRMWNVHTGMCTHTVKLGAAKVASPVLCCAVQGSSKQVWCSAVNGSLAAVDVARGTIVSQVDREAVATKLAEMSEHVFAWCGTGSGRVGTLDTRDPSTSGMWCAQTGEGSDAAPAVGLCCGDNNLIAAAWASGLRVWDVRNTASAVAHMRSPSADTSFTSLGVVGDARLLLGASDATLHWATSGSDWTQVEGGSAHSLDAGDARCGSPAGPVPTSITGFTSGTDQQRSHHYISAANDGVVRLHRVSDAAADSTVVHRFRVHAQPVYGASVHPEWPFLLSWGAEWDIGMVKFTLNQHPIPLSKLLQ